jgi:thiamine monophosphate kinase
MMEMAMAGGEDFELLFTVTKENASHFENIKATRIGEVTAKSGIIELIDKTGNRTSLPTGYRHF